jgi:glyoxylate/hydroxypyruvate reductase A
MAMLLYGLDNAEIGSAEGWRACVAELLPEIELRIFPEIGRVEEIDYLAFMHPDFDRIPALPRLKAMFSRSAGVESFIGHPKIPKVPLGKIEPAGGDPMMTEYVVMHVLRLHREMPLYAEAQARREWLVRRIVRPEERRIGFLGLGLMAKAPAEVLRSLGFPVAAWVRTPRQAGGIAIFQGPDQLQPFLGQTDILVCLLPLTRETEGILSAATFAAMPRGAMVINLGRGRHLVPGDLIAALESGQIAHAALDALYPEPLPQDSPLWSHPRVTVMPHVARRPTIRQLVTEIAANIRSIETGGWLLQEIDRGLGY